MVTRNVLECIQQMTARVQAVDQRKNELSMIAAPQTKNDWISVPVVGTRLPSLRTMYLWRLKRFCVILFIIGFAMRRPFQRCVYRGGRAFSCWDIALWVRRPTSSFLEAEKSVDKGLKRIFWWKPCEKIQWRSWYKMPSKLHGCIGLLYKVVQKTGRFSVFIFTIFFSF